MSLPHSSATPIQSMAIGMGSIVHGYPGQSRLRRQQGNREGRRKSSALCFRDMHSGLGNMADALQQLGSRLTNPEHYAQWGEFLKRNAAKIEVSFDDKKRALLEATNIPFGKPTLHNKSDEDEEERKLIELDLPFLSTRTIDAKTSRGDLSAAAISSIEQFSRLCGVTGKKMKEKFYLETPPAIHDDARNLVEYCCFCYLSRFSSHFHPLLKEAGFRRLVFITMLAWQEPYAENGENEWSHQHEKQDSTSMTWVVQEAAFVRIAPAVGGVADKPTVHNLFKTLSLDNNGLSLRVWNKYIQELARLHDARLNFRKEDRETLGLAPDESLLFVGGDKRQHVQLWNKNNIAWPGRLTLTERALYFEPNVVLQHWKPMKLELGAGGYVKRTKVGPFGAELFDSAIEVTPSSWSESWVLEFVDFLGVGLRELWFALIREMFAVFSFIKEFGPALDDPLVSLVYGSKEGSRKAIVSAINGVLSLRAAQLTIDRPINQPGTLLQFSFIRDCPSGEIVQQALALSMWGGNPDSCTKASSKALIASTHLAVANDIIGMGSHLVDIDGSVYLQQWMRSPTWSNSKSTSFWKHRTGNKGLIVGKELVIGGITYTDKAVKLCKEQIRMLEKTRATIDGALVKGIPSNIDLFKELMLPFTILSINLRRLQRWEDPRATVLFLATCSLVIFKNWLRFIFPATLLACALSIFTLHNLKCTGRLGDSFGKVTIKEQPPSNTLQKILALKEALAEVEVQIQKANISLLKIRSLILCGHPQSTQWLIFALVGAATILVAVPFQYILICILMDQFTCELEFRRGMVLRLLRQVKEWWETIPAVPVVILPHEDHHCVDGKSVLGVVDEASPSTKGESIAEAVREWFAEGY